MVHPLSRLGAKCFLLAFLPAVLSAADSIAQTPGAAAPTADKPVVASLVASKSSAAAGSTVTLGVLFKMAPEWHVYWRNPGETGFATEVQWSNAAGPITATTTLYPAPITFTSPGDLISYGYEKEVLLMTDVTIPAGASGQVQFTAKPRWLMCADRCIPGRDTLTVTIPVGADQLANAELFSRYRAQLPKDYESGSFPAGVTGKASPAAGGLQATLSIDTASGKIVGEDRHAAGLHRLYFFPYLADKDSGAVLGTPKVPEPDSTATTPAGTVKVYAKPVSISMQVDAGDTSKPAPTSVDGVLVLQRLGTDGKPQSAESANINIRQ